MSGKIHNATMQHLTDLGLKRKLHEIGANKFGTTIRNAATEPFRYHAHAGNPSLYTTQDSFREKSLLMNSRPSVTHEVKGDKCGSILSEFATGCDERAQDSTEIWEIDEVDKRHESHESLEQEILRQLGRTGELEKTHLKQNKLLQNEDLLPRRRHQTISKNRPMGLSRYRLNEPSVSGIDAYTSMHLDARPFAQSHGTNLSEHLRGLEPSDQSQRELYWLSERSPHSHIPSSQQREDEQRNGRGRLGRISSSVYSTPRLSWSSRSSPEFSSPASSHSRKKAAIASYPEHNMEYHDQLEARDGLDPSPEVFLDVKFSSYAGYDKQGIFRTDMLFIPVIDVADGQTIGKMEPSYNEFSDFAIQLGKSGYSLSLTNDDLECDGLQPEQCYDAAVLKGLTDKVWAYRIVHFVSMDGQRQILRLGSQRLLKLLNGLLSQGSTLLYGSSSLQTLSIQDLQHVWPCNDILIAT